jgi:hypothetical protein
MFSSITIASSTTKPTQSVSAISERLSRLYPQDVHHGERADERHRKREARDHRRGEIPQEEEDDEHDEAQRQQEREPDVVDRRADRDRPVERTRSFAEAEAASRTSAGAPESGRRLRPCSFPAASGSRRDRAHRPLVVDAPGGDLVVLDRVEGAADVLQAHGRPVAVGDDEGP